MRSAIPNVATSNFLWPQIAPLEALHSKDNPERIVFFIKYRNPIDIRRVMVGNNLNIFYLYILSKLKKFFIFELFVPKKLKQSTSMS